MDEVIRADTVKTALMPVFTAEDVRWLRDKLMQLSAWYPCPEHEDIVQIILLEVFEATVKDKIVPLEGQTWREALWNFARTIFKCKRKDWQKHNCRQYVKCFVSLEKMIADEKGGGKAKIFGIADPHPRMRHEKLALEILIKCCKDAVAVLDETASKVLLIKLASAEEKNSVDIAKELDMTPFGVRKALDRAKKVVLGLYAERLTR